MTDESTDSEAAEDESSAEDHPDLMRRIEMIEGIMENPWSAQPAAPQESLQASPSADR
jgi:hypothetical protein